MVIGTIAFKCPPKDIILPCRCFKWDAESMPPEIEILCENARVDEDSLRGVFNRLKIYVESNNYTSSFHSLRLENTAISALHPGDLGGLSFDSIDFFSNHDFSYIGAGSFNDSVSSLTTLSVQNSPIADNEEKPQDFYDAIKQLPNLETLMLAENYIKKLPANAFGDKDLKNLSHIDLNGNQISEIGDNAFAGLPKLNRLNLDNNQINFLNKSSFHFENDQSEFLLLYLRKNNLNSDSFESGLFSNVKQTLFIYLSQNNITYLDEQVFKPLLDTKSDVFVAVWKNPYFCDCKSKWLLQKRGYYFRRIYGIKCQDNRGLWDYSISELKNCD